MTAKRWDEELCKEATLAYVRSLGHAATARSGDDVNRAPDYVATIDDAEYALEVTRVVDAVQIHGGGTTLRPHVDDQMRRLAAAIEQRAAAEGVPLGQLFVGVFGSVIPNLTQRRPAIVDAVLAFLRTEQGTADHRDDYLRLEENGDEILRVVHHPKMATHIEVGGCDFLPAEQPVAGLRAALEDRITEKRRLLAGDKRPRILVLAALYITAAPKHYVDAFAGLAVDDFVAVLVVHSREKVRPLLWRVPSPSPKEGARRS